MVNVLPRKGGASAANAVQVRGAKRARIEARAAVEEKALIEEAALLKGMTFSDYVVSTATERAKADIAAERAWVLSHEESVRFVEAMQNPAPPTETLRADIALYFATRAK